MKAPRIFGGTDRKSRLQFLGESLAGCWVVALLGFSGYVLHFNSAPVGFLFLLAVVSEAILCGFWQATIVSLVASACLDYFYYPPLLRFNINDPQDWVCLCAFELSALVVSRMSTREQLSTREATLQRTSMEQLYELSRSTLLINLHRPPGPQLTHLIQRIFSVDAVAIFDANSGVIDALGNWDACENEIVRECYLLNEDKEDPSKRTFLQVLRVGSSSVGALAIRGSPTSLVMNALASLSAITLDRCVSFEKESRIEAAHQSERLRAAVLDSLAHAFKTPLTAIQTASSGLREIGPLNEPQIKLVSLVEDESRELNLLCTRLLQTAKLEAKELTVGRQEILVSDLVQSVLLDQAERMVGHPVEVEVRDPALMIRGDSTTCCRWLLFNSSTMQRSTHSKDKR